MNFIATRTYEVVAILGRNVTVKNHEGYAMTLCNINIPKYTIVGDLIRWCEHNFYDVVDEKGGFVYR